MFVSDELKKAMAEITEAYYTIAQSRKFIAELRRIRKEFQGRPPPISHLERLSNALGNVQLYVKREDLKKTIFFLIKTHQCNGKQEFADFKQNDNFHFELSETLKEQTWFSSPRSAWEKVKGVRQVERPSASDYISYIFDNFVADKFNFGWIWFLILWGA